MTLYRRLENVLLNDLVAVRWEQVEELKGYSAHSERGFYERVM